MSGFAKYTLLAVQLIGVVLSVFLLSVTTLRPGEVETRLQEFAIAKVEAAATAALDVSGSEKGETGRETRFQALSAQFGVEAEEAERLRKRFVPALVAHALSDRCRESCQGQLLIGMAVQSSLLARASAFRVGQLTLSDFIVERYDTAVKGLIADLRRFAIVNFAALALMMGLVLLRDLLNRRFFAFSAAVSGYVAWAAWGYLFEQDWAMAILLNDWAAPGYQLCMLFVSCVLADWLFLRGIVTQFVLAAIGSAISG